MSENSGSGLTGNAGLRSIAIVGGGTAGWMAASMLGRALPNVGLEITIIESAEIGTVGVGEATIPPILDLLRFLDINEQDFIRHTEATYKLGIRFTDWCRVGSSYWHPFGTFGVPINRRPFFHAWHKARAAGLEPRFTDFSLCAALGEAGRFRAPDASVPGPVAGLRYALHFDASLVARYLRAYSESLGVRRLERTVVSATIRADGGIDELLFADGSRLAADLYIDCSGFRGALIEDVLHTGYVDWSAMLPCDRAVAMPSESDADLAPFTHSIAMAAGWRWRIPLQHRVGNGYVYSSQHLTDEQAADALLGAVGGGGLAAPRFLRFVTGRRKQFWNRNCVALGLASGFLEPLESTSIHLVMSGVYNLLDHFPDANFDAENIAAYNRELVAEMERIRDFIVLHYCLTERRDTPLWRDCAAMPLPDTLRERIDIYRATGRVRPLAGELFTDLSWFYIFDGMGVRPRSYDPLMDVVSTDQLRGFLAHFAAAVATSLAAAPAHREYFPRRPVAAENGVAQGAR